MTPRPPGSLRVARALARVSLLRLKNRFAGNIARGFRLRRRRRSAPSGARPVRTIVGLFVIGVFGPVFAFQAFMISSQVVAGLAASVVARDIMTAEPIPVSPRAYERLHERLQAAADLSARRDETPRGPARDGLATSERAVEDDIDRLLDEEATRAFAVSRMYGWSGQAGDEAGDPRVDALAARMKAALAQKGLPAFEGVEALEAQPIATSRVWPGGAGGEAMLRAVGLAFVLVGGMILFGQLSMGNRDLAKLDWDVEWLFTFPVKARSIFAARLFEYTFINPWGWITCAPFLLAVFIAAGRGWYSVWYVLAATVLVNLALASVRLASEAVLRRYLPLKRVKNVQAASTVATILCMAGAMSIAYTTLLARPLAALAGASPSWPLWLPVFLPVEAARGGAAAGVAFAMLSALALAAGWGALRLSEALAAGGLVAVPTVHAGRRAATGAASEDAGSLLRGVIGKDVRYILRDCALMVRVLVVPVLIAGIQIVINPRLLTAGWADYRHAAALAWGMAVVVLLSGALPSLTFEGRTLWLLYTFPVDDRRGDAAKGAHVDRHRHGLLDGGSRDVRERHGGDAADGGHGGGDAGGGGAGGAHRGGARRARDRPRGARRQPADVRLDHLPLRLHRRWLRRRDIRAVAAGEAGGARRLLAPLAGRLARPREAPAAHARPRVAVLPHRAASQEKARRTEPRAKGQVRRPPAGMGEGQSCFASTRRPKSASICG